MVSVLSWNIVSGAGSFDVSKPPDRIVFNRLSSPISRM